MVRYVKFRCGWDGSRSSHCLFLIVLGGCHWAPDIGDMGSLLAPSHSDTSVLSDRSTWHHIKLPARVDINRRIFLAPFFRAQPTCFPALLFPQIRSLLRLFATMWDNTSWYYERGQIINQIQISPQNLLKLVQLYDSVPIAYKTLKSAMCWLFTWLHSGLTLAPHFTWALSPGLENVSERGLIYEFSYIQHYARCLWSLYRFFVYFSAVFIVNRVLSPNFDHLSTWVDAAVA